VRNHERANFLQNQIGSAVGGVRGWLFLARLPEAFQRAGQSSGLLETEIGGESGAGSLGESHAAEKRLAGRPDLGT
jgi:hypothetical protein